MGEPPARHGRPASLFTPDHEARHRAEPSVLRARTPEEIRSDRDADREWRERARLHLAAVGVALVVFAGWIAFSVAVYKIWIDPVG